MLGLKLNHVSKRGPWYIKTNPQLLSRSAIVCSLNLLQSEGLFPDELKITNVAPMYKAEDSTRLNNYRIVSLLCILSKVLKKVIYIG